MVDADFNFKMPKIEMTEQSEDGKYGRFVVEPLERGYGLTLGNSLRRIMLSSLVGTAVSSIKIEGVLHEFSSIPGVKEDVTEIVMNIKQLSIKNNGNSVEPKEAHIEFVGEGVVRASDIQVDADLKIGTAAPTPEQLQRVKHHLVGTLQLTDYYSAAQYEAEVLRLLETLFTEQDTVLLTGGSMMYVDAVCKGIDDIPTVDAETRQVMLHKYETEGLERLCAELKLLDPEYYRIVDLKNPKRVIHALEICYMTGKTYTSFRTQQKKERPFRIIKIGLTRDREELYERINRRVEIMIEDGLEEEARKVYPYRALNSLNTVGYKEMFKYLDGEWTLPFAIEKIQQNSRIYSRKQMTWFRKDEEIRWFHPEQETEILAYLRSVM